MCSICDDMGCINCDPDYEWGAICRCGNPDCYGDECEYKKLEEE